MSLTEQLEDVRGEVIESSKQRKRERADLVRPGDFYQLLDV